MFVTKSVWLLSIGFLLSLLASIGGSGTPRQFLFKPRQINVPKLVLITGCTGTGKSTFGMTVALNKGILKCISTDTVRQIMRSFNDSAALHRSSYTGDGDPVQQWKECCNVLSESIDSLVDDSIARGVSLVLEGVHVVPSDHLIKRWEEAGGVALGCILTIEEEECHRNLIYNRGEITGKGASKQVEAFSRIRAIQAEMIRLADEHKWIKIEQKITPDPIEIIEDILDSQSRVIECQLLDY